MNKEKLNGYLYLSMEKEKVTKRLVGVVVVMFLFMVLCFVMGEYFDHKKLESHSSEQSETLLKALTEELQDKMDLEVEPTRQDKGDLL